MTYVRKKYTKVFICTAGVAEDTWQQTISLIGAKNSNSPVEDTITLTDMDEDGQLEKDMDLYQFFRIRGVAFKLFFPMPTDPDSSPV